MYANVLICVLLLATLSSTIADFYVCSAANPAFLGKYVKSETTNDGAAVYSNANDMSIFRNRDFWYMGNLAPWPPETHYRCVEPESCNFGEEDPALYTLTEGASNWKPAKKFGQEPVPMISELPCEGASEEL
jgi:hypothetical protein